MMQARKIPETFWQT